MKSLKRLWQGLEALPGLAGVLAEWREVWGQTYEVGKAFLRPTDQLASSYPCPSPGGDGCPRGVVVHSDDDIVAVCRQRPKQCNSIKLTRADVLVYELNRKGLCSAVASALGVIPLSRPANVLPQAFRIGHYPLATGRRAPVYLAIQHEAQSLRDTVWRLLAKSDSSCILITPTSHLCNAETQGMLSEDGALLLALDDVLALDDTRAIVATEHARVLLSDFAAGPAACRGAASATRRPTARRSPQMVKPVRMPEEAEWKDLHLTLDDHRLGFRLLEEHGERSFQTAGFDDRRRRDFPNHLWELLQQFARGGGKLREEPKDSKKRQNLKYSISKLRASLHALFPLPGEPIVKREGEDYTTTFRITAKDRVVIPVPADTTWHGISVIETRTGKIRFVIDTKKRYMAFSDGRVSGFSKEFPKEAAERLDTETRKCDLWELGLLADDGQLNQMGQELLDLLRNGGRVKRDQNDNALIELGGLLCRITGMKGSPFEYHFDRKEWTSVFAAGSEGRPR